MKKDAINPTHYSSGTYETINIIEHYELDFCLGNVIKYVLRHKGKNGLEDLQKAKWYLERAISNNLPLEDIPVTYTQVSQFSNPTSTKEEIHRLI